MSLYHETAEILSESGGILKTRIFTKKHLKSTPQQVYALALETCKWSSVLKEVIEASELLRHERKLSPVLSLLLVHDFLLAKGGIALPATHGLRASVERHKARLSAEFTRARIRRKAASVEALRKQVTAEYVRETARHPRWVRVNTLKSTLEDQLDSTFKDFTRVYSIGEIKNTNSNAASAAGTLLYVDEHVPNLLAVSPSFEVIKTEAYKSGAIILQDKASCFPAYLLDPLPQDGNVIDSCAAPGNKTTHLAALVHSRVAAVREGEFEGKLQLQQQQRQQQQQQQMIYAIEKDKNRARTLEKMIKVAGAEDLVRISRGQDFLKVDPSADLYKDVGALLLDPSCSGSGIVGRDAMPIIHLPEPPATTSSKANANAKKSASNKSKGSGGGDNNTSRKRKRPDDDDKDDVAERLGEILFVDDDGAETVVATPRQLQARLEALASFQLSLLLHALAFPAARKVTYSTCSVHAVENEQVVRAALRSDIARRRGWRVLRRAEQVRGMREWPVRGVALPEGDGDEGDGDEEEEGLVADACIRAYKDDGRGVMGFFVAGFVRDIQGPP